MSPIATEISKLVPSHVRVSLSHDGTVAIVTCESQQERDDLMDWLDSNGFYVKATRWNQFVTSRGQS